MTTRTLNRKMTELTQESPKSFITRVRMETAAMLLENRGKTVSQVATECGYNDETAFRRAFNAVMGMSPGMYKEWVKNRSRSGDMSVNGSLFRPDRQIKNRAMALNNGNTASCNQG
jgi:AraC-like DNA-binding protein